MRGIRVAYMAMIFAIAVLNVVLGPHLAISTAVLGAVVTSIMYNITDERAAP